MIKIPELLVPVGGNEQLRAAIACGADAVYMGGSAFNARMNADNFNSDELSAAIDMAHEYGVKVHITENTLIKNGELPAAVEHAVRMYECGADALIIQDRGLADVLRSVIPDMPLHLSTQGTVYDSAGVIEAERSGFSRVILSRELAFDEIGRICAETSAEIEIFVHGAICICYSGQCHMSYFLGGRSGNRGVCAQPCRLLYSLSNGRKTRGYNYLLSPSDMCLLPHLQMIAETGVDSLKIEGRMKSPEYVAAVTSVYRKYLDELASLNSDGIKNQNNNIKTSNLQQDIKMLRQVFNRGDFTDAYFTGEKGGRLMSSDIPKHKGVKIGELVSFDGKKGHAVIKLFAELSNGDGIEIRDRKENVGNVITYIKERSDLCCRADTNKLKYSKKKNSAGKKSEYNAEKNNLITIAKPGMIVEIGDIPALFQAKDLKAGAGVYKITDKALMKNLSKKYEKLPQRIAVNFQFNAVSGKKAVLTASVCDYADCLHVSVTSDKPLEEAVKKPADEESVKKQLLKTGGTPYYAASCDIFLKGSPMIPASELNNMRRSVLDKMTVLRINSVKPETEENQWKSLYNNYFNQNINIANIERSSNNINTEKSLSENIYNDDEIHISIYFHETYDNEGRIYRFAAKIAERKDIKRNIRLFIPYGLICGKMEKEIDIFKYNIKLIPYISAITKGISSEVLKLSADRLTELYKNGLIEGVSIGHPSQLGLFKDIPLFFDESMNLYNKASVYYGVKNNMKCGMISHELDVSDIAGFKDAAEACEIAVYGRAQLMVTEHCPVGVGEGIQECIKSGKKHYCRHGDCSLRDKKGNVFPVICDDSVCRAKILSHKSLDRLKYINEMRAAGINNFRIYVFDETPDEIFDLNIFKSLI
ncbi:MAG: U32 family peptidase [Firmicutes bacterium]|nr:U32 family peptidase [Bacillota bacterium]